MWFYIKDIEHDNEEPPIPGAEKTVLIKRDIRTADAPEKIPHYEGRAAEARNDWFGRGCNHRVEEGKIIRDFKEEVWGIWIITLEGLCDLIEANPELALTISSKRFELRDKSDY